MQSPFRQSQEHGEQQEAFVVVPCIAVGLAKYALLKTLLRLLTVPQNTDQP